MLFFQLLRYSDADFAGCPTEQKRTSGTCYILKNCLVPWGSKKQNPVALKLLRITSVDETDSWAFKIFMYTMKIQVSQIYTKNQPQDKTYRH